MWEQTTPEAVFCNCPISKHIETRGTAKVLEFE